MSHSQYLIDIARNGVKVLLDRSQLPQKAPQIYRTLLDNLFAPQGTPLLQSLLQYLDQQTQAAWRTQGVPQEQLYNILRPWTQQSVDLVEKSFMQQQPQAAYGQMGGGYGGMQPGFGGASHNLNPTANMYDSGRSSAAPPDSRTFSLAPVIMEGVGGMVPAANLNTDYDLGRPVSMELHRASNADLPQSSNGVLSVRNYHTGEHEKTRLLTSEITLRVAQNTADAASKLAYRYAPQEVIRGMFANVVLYQELVHIPTGYKDFVAIAKPVWEAFSKENNWRAALEVLNSRTKGEWEIMSRALCRQINDMIYRRIRANEPGVMILGIENLEDLSVMDDRNAEFAVARHAKYWPVFNRIISKAIEDLFDPENLIGPTDENFGDFVNCDEIVFYSDGRSKFDYGTFEETVDRVAFIDRMMATDTVVRIPRAAIMTNALDSRLVAQVKRFKPTEQLLLSGVNTVGTALLSSLDYIKQHDVQMVVCMDQSPDKQHEIIKIGVTLDETLTLLPSA